jgi:hypothetical protein
MYGKDGFLNCYKPLLGILSKGQANSDLKFFLACFGTRTSTVHKN